MADKIIKPRFHAGAVEDKDIGLGDAFHVRRARSEAVGADISGDDGFHDGAITGDGGRMGVDWLEGGEDVEFAGIGGCFGIGTRLACGEQGEEWKKEKVAAMHG
jgi:hypothetical protein